jgi:hypothetical protein
LETDAERVVRLNAEREDELKRVPLQNIDKSRWPKNVRPIAMAETGGLGIDNDGRLHWNGKPVEIIGRRLDLTGAQNFVACLGRNFHDYRRHRRCRPRMGRVSRLGLQE